MSTFFPEPVPCPHCGDVEVRAVAHSINVSRTPELRERILAREFQVHGCRRCGRQFGVDQPFIYVDFDRRDWIGEFSLEHAANWAAYEPAARNALHRACGPEAPSVAQDMGVGMRVRTVFGLAALREKLVCADAGLDDVVLEALKYFMFESLEPLQEQPACLRLVAVTARDDLVFEVESELRSSDELDTIELRRDAYLQVAQDLAASPGLVAALTASTYVDCERLRKA